MAERVTLESMSYGSDAVGHLSNGKAVFVRGGVPGDVVELNIVQEKPRFARAFIDRVIEPSAARVASLCPQADRCGGCSWSHLSYEAQLQAKRSHVVNGLVRTAHFDESWAQEKVKQVVPSKRQWGYRNKLELACTYDAAGHLVLGMRPEGSSEVLPLDSCPLAHRTIAQAPKVLRGALRYLSQGQDLNLFRVGVRASLRTHDVEIALWTEAGSFPRAATAKTLESALRNNSCVRVIGEAGRARKVKKVEVLSGQGFWRESLNDLLFSVSAPSFFQVNTAQAERLVEEVLGGLSVTPGDYVADLYAGVGTFSLALAARGADVVAVESAGSSVRDLRRNGERAQLPVDVVGGDAARELVHMGKLDGLVVDPPRSGLASGVAASIAQAAPKRLAYVSCDPVTWARDVALLQSEGYRLTQATPVDLFPQTYHVEVVSIFERCPA